MRGQGPVHDGLLHPGRHPVPLGAGRGVHLVRQLPLLGVRPDQPEPPVHVDRDDRPGRHRRRPRSSTTAPRSTTSSCPGPPTRSGCSGRASAGRCTRRRTTTTTTRWPGSSRSATRRRHRRCGSGACASARRAGSRPTPGRAGCRRCPGWSRRPRRPSTRTTSRPPERSTSPASWTPSPPTRTCGPRPLFILTYDENDGLFDHVPPPVGAAAGAGRVRRRAADRARLPGPGHRSSRRGRQAATSAPTCSTTPR